MAPGYGSTRGSTSTHGAMSHGLIAAPPSEARSSVPASTNDPPPLAGFTVAVATDKRTHDMAAWLEAEGARTIGVRAVRTIPQPDADTIAEAVRMCVAEPVHEVVVSSAFGLRAWLAAARRTGHLDDLLGCFNEARLLARDAGTADGLRELGLTQIWSTAAATTEDLFRYLLAQPMTGRRVVAQIETDAQQELCHALRAVGAVVVEVATSQFAAPTHVDVVRRLNDLVMRRHVDAVVLAGAAVAANLVDQAVADASLDEMLNALVDDVMAVCMGPLDGRAADVARRSGGTRDASPWRARWPRPSCPNYRSGPSSSRLAAAGSRCAGRRSLWRVSSCRSRPDLSPCFGRWRAVPVRRPVGGRNPGHHSTFVPSGRSRDRDGGVTPARLARWQPRRARDRADRHEARLPAGCLKGERGPDPAESGPRSGGVSKASLAWLWSDC